MNIRSADLNLLKVAASLFKTGNVSRSAELLGLSQSAVSHALGRLRRDLGDPCFVRTSKGVTPTEFARSIEAELVDLVARAENLVARRSSFDPATARGRITIASTDYLEAVVFPTLLPRLLIAAPGVQVSLRPTHGDLPRRELEDGRIDLAVAGFYERVPEGFMQSQVGRDVFACAVRKNHGRIKSRLTREDYFAAKHALITLQGDFEDDIDDEASTGKKRRPREIQYGSYSFSGMAWLLSRSDLVLTAPRQLLEAYASRFPIKVFACPVPIEPIQFRMIWHARSQRDPLRAWFRAAFRDACSKALRPV